MQILDEGLKERLKNPDYAYLLLEMAHDDICLLEKHIAALQKMIANLMRGDQKKPLIKAGSRHMPPPPPVGRSVLPEGKFGEKV